MVTVRPLVSLGSKAGREGLAGHAPLQRHSNLYPWALLWLNESWPRIVLPNFLHNFLPNIIRCSRAAYEATKIGSIAPQVIGQVIGLVFGWVVLTVFGTIVRRHWASFWARYWAEFWASYRASHWAGFWASYWAGVWGSVWVSLWKRFWRVLAPSTTKGRLPAS